MQKIWITRIISALILCVTLLFLSSESKALNLQSVSGSFYANDQSFSSDVAEKVTFILDYQIYDNSSIKEMRFDNDSDVKTIPTLGTWELGKNSSGQDIVTLTPINSSVSGLYSEYYYIIDDSGRSVSGLLSIAFDVNIPESTGVDQGKTPNTSNSSDSRVDQHVKTGGNLNLYLYSLAALSIVSFIGLISLIILKQKDKKNTLL